MIVAVVGSRDWKDLKAVRVFVMSLEPGTVVISGGAGGADQAAALAALSRLDLPSPVIIAPDYGQNPKWLAPKVRNWEIARTCDRLVAFWDGWSGGTAHVIAAAMSLGKPVDIVRSVVRQEEPEAALSDSPRLEDPL